MNATPAKTALPAYHQVDYKGHVIYYVNGEYRADGNEFKDMNAAKAHIDKLESGTYVKTKTRSK